MWPLVLPRLARGNNARHVRGQMILEREVRSARKPILQRLPALRHHDRASVSIFWMVTVITALWTMLTLIVDAIFTWERIISDPTVMWITVMSWVAALIWVLVPMIMREALPRWFGALGYLIITLVVIYNLVVQDDPVIGSTALHILPVVCMYVGWFWGRTWALSMFLTSFVAVSIAVFNSQAFTGEGLLNEYIAIFNLLLMALAFIISSYLRGVLRQTAFTDPLTGALNARGFEHRLEEEISRARRKQEPLSIASIDLDRFKELNDTYGLRYGDDLLMQTVSYWRNHLRDYDIISRIGGDEFIIIFPNTTPEQASNALQRIYDDSQIEWSWGSDSLREGDDAESLVRRADDALYRQKKLKRQQVPQTERGHHGKSDRPSENRDASWPPRQNHFSLTSAAVGFIVSFPLLITQFIAVGNGTTGWVIWVAIVMTLVGTLVPLLYGTTYPRTMSKWTSFTILVIYTVFAYLTESISHGIGIVYAMSIVAIYLGIFSGTVGSRILMILSIVCVSIPAVLNVLDYGTDIERDVLYTTIAYSFIVCLILFEMSSYLYHRSLLYAEHDGLTGVLNRFGLEAYGHQEFNRAMRGRYPISAVLLDCVGFKAVNDTHGHAAGDALLRDVAEYLNMHCETGDLIFRTGGDEFLILMPYLNREEALLRTQRMIANAPIQMSIGVSDAKEGDTFDDLLARADLRLTGYGKSRSRTGIDTEFGMLGPIPNS